jgi:hypothetical protein
MLLHAIWKLVPKNCGFDFVVTEWSFVSTHGGFDCLHISLKCCKGWVSFRPYCFFQHTHKPNVFQNADDWIIN